MPIAISYGDGSFNVLTGGRSKSEAKAMQEAREEVKFERDRGDKKIKVVRIKAIEVVEVML